MGFLDSILKKEKAPEAGEEDAPPEAVETPVSTGPKPNPLAKLKGYWIIWKRSFWVWC